MIDQLISTFISQAVTAVVAALGSVWLLFKFWFEKRIGAKFEKESKQFEHEKNQILENHKNQLNILADRTYKLHQQEFVILPQTWAVMLDAYHAVRSLVSPIQLGSDLNTMNQAQFDEFLKDVDLLDWEKKELAASSDKTEYYQNRISWHRAKKTHDKYSEFHRFFLKNKIFLQHDVKEKFTELDDLIHKALGEYKGNLCSDFMRRSSEYEEKLEAHGKYLVDRLEKAISKILRADNV